MLRLTQQQRDLLTQHVENALITRPKKQTNFLGFTITVSADKYIVNKIQCAKKVKNLIANAFKLMQTNTLKTTPINVSEARQSLLSRDHKKADEANKDMENIEQNITELGRLIDLLDRNTQEKLEDLVHCIPGKMDPADRIRFINQHKKHLKVIEAELEGMQNIFEEQLNPTPPPSINSYL